jgi:hypothetical protein
MRTRYLLHPKLHRISKFLPHNPPERGNIVLVEDFEGLRRCRVARAPKVEWEGSRWTLRSPIHVVPAEMQ